ncbi:hypothetical protein EDD86DRAFT_259046 [Gorgonomyces haynaldii]|nr:hypothetical protein EDD86DRAFT_259046 [Gorgonomyces haynaldii]
MEDKAVLWNMIYNMTHHNVPLVHRKMLKILVDYAGVLFPDYWPTYLGDIESLYQKSPHVCLSLLELTIVSFLSPQFCVSSNRAKLLKTQIALAFPRIFSFIVGYMKQSLQHFVSNAYPSPTSPSKDLREDTSIQTCDLALDAIECFLEFDKVYESGEFLEMIAILFEFSTLSGSCVQLGLKSLSILEQTIAHKYFPENQHSTLLLLANTLLSRTRSLEYTVDERLEKWLDVLLAFSESHIPRIVKQRLQFDILGFLEAVCCLLSKQEDDCHCMVIFETMELIMTKAELDDSILTAIVCLTMDKMMQIPEIEEIGLDLLGKASDMSPRLMIRLVEQQYTQSQRYVESSLDTPQREEAIQKFRLVIRLVGRMSNLFVDAFEERRDIGLGLFQRQLQAFCHCTLDNGRCSDVFSSLTMFMDWVAKYWSSISEKGTFEQDIHRLIELAVYAGNYRITSLCENSTQMLVMLSEVLPYDFLHVPGILDLLHSIHMHCFELDPVSRKNLYNFATDVIISFPDINKAEQQTIQQRSEMYLAFINPVLQDLTMQGNTDKILYAINVLEGSCRTLENASLVSRRIVFAGLSRTIESFEQLIVNACEQPSLALRLIDLYLLFISTFSKFLSQGTKNTLVSMTGLLFDLLETKSAPDQVLDRCLNLIEVFSLDAGVRQASYLPLAIPFAVEMYSKHLRLMQTAPDVLPRFYNLIFNILQNDWRYFFGSKVQTMAGSPQSRQKVHEFKSLLEMLLSSLETNETDQLKLTLQYLNALHQRHHLFENSVFRMDYLVLSSARMIELGQYHHTLQDEFFKIGGQMIALDYSDQLKQDVG